MAKGYKETIQDILQYFIQLYFIWCAAYAEHLLYNKSWKITVLDLAPVLLKLFLI